MVADLMWCNQEWPKQHILSCGRLECTTSMEKQWNKTAL